MPNHLHALIYFSRTDKSINKIIGDGKRFMAYAMIKRLKEKGREDILQRLRNAGEAKDRQRGKMHEIWEDSFDCKICNSEKFMNQKLAYMHRQLQLRTNIALHGSMFVQNMRLIK